MVPTLLLITWVGIGVDVGWKPTPDGRIEYMIQVTPEEMQNLDVGDIIAASDVPAGLPPIAAYRIVVGRGPLPRELPNRPAEAETRGSDSNSPRQANDPNKVTHVAEPAVGVFPTEPKQLPASPTALGSTSGSSQPTDTTSPHDGLPEAKSTSNAAQSTASEPQPEDLGNRSSSRGPFLVIVATIFFAVCLASVALAAWIAADYRRKYRELVANFNPSLANSDDSHRCPTVSEVANTRERQQASP